MVAMSSLRVLGSSSPSLYQPRRFPYAGGMGAIPTPRFVAAASAALPRAPRLAYARDIGAISSLRVVAAASPALPHARRLHYASELGATSPLRVVALAPASPAMARPQRLPTTVFLYPGSPSRFTAAAPGLHAHCLPPRPAEGTEALPTPPHSPSTPDMPGWWHVVRDFSSATTRRRFLHLLAVFLLSSVKRSEFKGFVEWASTRLQLPQKVTVAILLGATAISILFEAAVMGKDINDVCSYLLTHGPKVHEADMEKSVSSTSD